MKPRPSNTSELYHRATKYSPEALSSAAAPLDWSRRPPLFKDYHSDRKVGLAAHLPWEGTPFTPRRPARGEARWPELGRLSRILYLTNGATSVVRGGEDEHWYRAAPSAGALYPTEIYLATRGVPGVGDGIHNYSVREHALVPLWDGDFWRELEAYTFDHEAVAPSRVVALLTAVYERSAWRYRERAYRRILLDSGHVLGNLAAAARLEDLRAHALAGFHDAAFAGLMFLDESREGLILAVPLPAAAGLEGVRVRRSAVYPSPPHPVEETVEKGEIMQRLHAASAMAGDVRFREGLPVDTRALEALHADKRDLPLPGRGADPGRDLPRTILRRRSARTYSGAALGLEALGSILAWAYRPAVSDAPAAALPEVLDPGLLETYLAVHRVEGLEPGVYYYAPASHSLRFLKGGDVRRETWHICLGQELARDAAAVVFHTADLPAAHEKHRDRAYRYLHLDAGHIGQRMNLMAVHSGAGACGIGGFFEDEVAALFRLPRSQIVVYITTLGVPIEEAR